MEIKILGGREVIEFGLAEEIIEFDRENMRPVFEHAGMEFPEEKRRKGLQSDPTAKDARAATHSRWSRANSGPRFAKEDSRS